MKCRAYAKALHYKEEEFHRGPTTQILESLIRFPVVIFVVRKIVFDRNHFYDASDLFILLSLADLPM